MFFKKVFQRIDAIEQKIESIQTTLEAINSIAELTQEVAGKKKSTEPSVNDAIEAYKRLRGDYQD